MHGPIRRAAGVFVAALLLAACAGNGGVTVDPLSDVPDDDVLSPCEPASGVETVTLVEGDGPRPPVEVMEEAIAGHPDFEYVVEEAEAEGRSREDALHDMYAQVVGDRLFADARQLPGFITGAYARPSEDEPFQLSFSGDVPEEFDPDSYDLDSFGLEVTTGAAGLDHEAMTAAVDAASEIGMRMVSASGDEVTGTARIEVIDPTPEQVQAWEDAVEDPSRWCLVRAERVVACDDEVIAEAEQRAERQGEVMPNEQTDEPPTRERAEEVRRSYLGLTLEEAREKAELENRQVRVVIEDGVPLGVTDDLVPGRLDLTVCQDVVVDARMELEPRA